MNEHIIEAIVKELCTAVKANGTCAQLFDSDIPKEYRNVVADKLMEHGIDRVSVTPFVDAYFPSNMDEAERAELLNGYRSSAEVAYELMLIKKHEAEQAKMAADSLAYAIALALADILGFPDDDEASE